MRLTIPFLINALVVVEDKKKKIEEGRSQRKGGQSMSLRECVEAEFRDEEVQTLLHALRHYEEYCAKLVETDQGSPDELESYNLRVEWEHAKKLKDRIEQKVATQWDGLDPNAIY